MDYNKISELAKEKRMSIPQIADKIGMSKRGLYVALKENSVRVDTLEKIAEVLGVRASHFFDSEHIEKLEKEKDDLVSMLAKKEEQANSIVAYEAKYLSIQEKSKMQVYKLNSIKRELMIMDTVIKLLLKEFSTLQKLAEPHIKESILNKYPDLDDKKDGDLIRQYINEDGYNIELNSFLRIIEPFLEPKIDRTLKNIGTEDLP